MCRYGGECLAESPPTHAPLIQPLLARPASTAVYVYYGRASGYLGSRLRESVPLTPELKGTTFLCKSLHTLFRLSICLNYANS